MRYLLLAVLVLAATAAVAGETVTYKPVTFALLDPTGTPVTKGYATLELCVAAAPVPAVGYRCGITYVFTKVGTCDDVPKPQVRVVLDAQGFLVQPGLKVEALPDGSWGPTMEQGYIEGPKVNGTSYPNCWVPGLVPYTGEWTAPEGPLSFEPTPWLEGVDFPMGEDCPVLAQAIAGCIKSPNVPREPPPGCTSEYCVTG